MPSSIVPTRPLIAAVILAAASLQAPPAAATALDRASVSTVDISADPTAGEARTRTYSRADLRNFVIAAVQIDRVLRRQSQTRRSENTGSWATDPSDRIRTIIEATPRLDPARYRAINEAVRTDPVLRSRLRRVIQDLRAEKHEALRPLTADIF
jgi:membrane-bound lytic murein transglycosylase B